jgi:RND superfamily putative drug exporter
VARVTGAPGVFEDGQRVAPPGPALAAFAAPDAAYLALDSRADYFSAEAQRLVARVRATAAPAPVLVGGPAAALADSRTAIGDRLGPVALVIVLATLVLIFLLTGGVLVTVKALVMNGLSLAATFGLLVWIFQDGHLSGVLGFQPTGWVDVTLLVLLFCVAFGVSMDYEVFILSRVAEEYARTGDNRRAVAFGIERNARLVTAAAVIISIVFVAMAASRVTNMKMFGVGLAIAILLDAFVVRTLLVPALMRLAGAANWWAPGPLRRLHRRFGLEHSPAEAGQAPPVPVAAGGFGGPFITAPLARPNGSSAPYERQPN